jgi:hypothetical protein
LNEENILSLANLNNDQRGLIEPSLLFKEPERMRDFEGLGNSLFEIK